MARKKANYPLIESLEIVSVAAEGKALGRYNDVVVFVPMAVPGDVVDVQVRSKRRRFMEGYIVRFVKKSPMRVDPVCEHYGVCGGCKWQHLPYEEQLRFKQEQVTDQLARIGKVDLPAVSPIIGSEKTFFYRNKLEFTFSSKRWLTDEEVASGTEFTDNEALGFHIPNMFDKVLDIRKCWLQADPSNPIRMAVREFCIAGGYSFYNPREHAGLMRNLIVRTSSTGEVMVIVIFGGDDRERIGALMEHLALRFPEITSLMYVVNTKFNDTIGDLDIQCYKGRDHIFEEMEGLRFKIGPKSFYQTNSALNGIDNTVFYAGDMKDVLNDRFIAENGRPDVVILDPPRAGIHEDVARTVLRAAPQRIVYVSCNPATQARDIAIFDADYRVTRIQPVDMFPHTHHVENVVQLVRR